jgi:hypothetical protein
MPNNELNRNLNYMITSEEDELRGLTGYYGR